MEMHAVSRHTREEIPAKEFKCDVMQCNADNQCPLSLGEPCEVDKWRGGVRTSAPGFGKLTSWWETGVFTSGEVFIVITMKFLSLRLLFGKFW